LIPLPAGKEVTMAVKIFIKRKIKEGQLLEASRLISRIRYGAMEQKGYISSETLTDHNDTSRVLVISMWHELEDWNAWKNSGERKEISDSFRAIVDAPTEYEIYDLGMRNE
jgi:heme-degrading monooxygenase HmoA